MLRAPAPVRRQLSERGRARRDEAELVKYAACMRTHGVPGFPDPTVNSHEIGFHVTGIDPTSAAFGRAQARCRSLMPGSR